MFCIYVLLTLNHPTNLLSLHYMDILRSGALVSSATHTTERNAVKKILIRPFSSNSGETGQAITFYPLINGVTP